MPSILAEIATYLDTKPNVRAALRGKVFAGRAPDTVLMPYVLLSRVATLRDYTTVAELSLTQSVVQLDVFAEDPKGHLEADDIFERIRDAMSGYSGTMGSTIVYGCTIERQLELIEHPGDSSDGWYYQATADYRLTHSQAVPTL